MHYLPQNLKFIRKSKNWTQEEFARQLGVKRSMIGAYEEGRADPRITFIQLLCEKFGYSLDALINHPLDENSEKEVDTKGNSIRILPIVVNQETGNESATLVPVKAAAGYLNGYGDVEFIEKLPVFELPFPELPKDRTYRIFQIKGDSMLPVQPNSYIICSYIDDWTNVRNDQRYIIVSKSEGIVFKRVLNALNQGYFTLKSDNPEYEPYNIKIADIIEMWRAEGVTQFGFHSDQKLLNNILFQELNEIKSELASLKQKLD